MDVFGWEMLIEVTNNKRLLHDIFHIGPGISPRLPYKYGSRVDTRDDMENFMS